MIIVKLSGGLGNQMFEYALGRALSLCYNQVLILDNSAYKKTTPNTPRRYYLNFFNIKARSFCSLLLFRILFLIDYILKSLFNAGFFIREKQVYKWDNSLKINKFGINYIYGYWQSYKYFEEFNENILKDFTPKVLWSENLKSVDQKICNSSSVSIHIRRGDYVGNKDYEVCSLDYYKKSLDFFENNCKNLTFFVFSDDIEWVKQNLDFKSEVVFVSGRGFNEAEELVLMSHCKYNIISNSSFSWWAAWLNSNPNKKIIMPDRWSNAPGLELVPDLLPDNWVRLK